MPYIVALSGSGRLYVDRGIQHVRSRKRTRTPYSLAQKARERRGLWLKIVRFSYWPSKRLKTNPGCWLEVAQGWAMSENKDLMAIVVVGCGVIVSLLTPAHRSLANKRKYETC